MALRDTKTGYGLISRLFHWLMAVAIIGLFALGLWMVELDYYSPYYNAAPNLHRSAGMLVLAALLVRFIWRISSIKPEDDGLTSFEARTANIVHWGFYPLLLGLLVSGYFISTLDGRGIDVFGWFTVPAVIESKGYESLAGKVHEILAYATMLLVALHTAAALKHHLVDKSPSLARMWSGPSSGV